LGAGFQLASHDLDIRGAGNLLGEEQSGHIKEVGFELYQSMLEEAILNLKAGVVEPAADRWSPQITIGMPVLIPEDYVNDLAVRLSLYRRLADLETDEEIDNFAAEMRDRFGVLPDEVRYLFKVAAIKAYCRRANVEKVDAGPKGAVISFRDNKFAQPDRLVFFIRQHGQAAKVRPDMKVVFLQTWKTPEERLMGTTEILRQLAKEEKVMPIDLNLWSKDFYEALGQKDSPIAFAPMDNTHHNLYFYLDTLRQIRDAIASHRFLNYIMEFKAKQEIG
jgi:transcription-repair coupling factor (superfamily II helicase)